MDPGAFGYRDPTESQGGEAAARVAVVGHPSHAGTTQGSIVQNSHWSAAVSIFKHFFPHQELCELLGEDSALTCPPSNENLSD